MSALPQPADNDTPPPLEVLPAPPPDLWHRYHATGPGDASEEELVKRYLPLVKSVVGRLAMNLPSHIDAEELQSAGMVGLLNAVRNFNPANGAPFEAYARLRIRGAVLDELRRLDWAPRSVHVKARRVQNVLAQWEQQHGGLPTDSEAAGALDISLDEYHRWLADIRPVTFICLDAAINDDTDEMSPHEIIWDPSADDAASVAVRADLAELIAERMQQLPDLHRKIVALYYFEDLRLREISEVCGLSESRICQIHTQAILAIRSYIENCESRDEKP